MCLISFAQLDLLLQHQQQRTLHLWPEEAEQVETNYYWSKPEPEPNKPYYYYGKSGKGAAKGGGGSSYYGKSGKGSKIEGGGYYYEPEPEPYYWSDPEPEEAYDYYDYGKGGKGSKVSKSSKSSKGDCGKSGKGSDCSVEGGGHSGGQWTFHYLPVAQPEPYWPYPEPEESPEPIDHTAPGICGLSYSNGGLGCDSDYDYCTEPGTQAECGEDYTCYDKELCPIYATDYPVGVCGAYGGGGLECTEVTTYCSEPGENAECGADRLCYDAGLCGLVWGDDGYGGVCGMPPSANGKKSKLDCDAVTTKCTEPGKGAECAYGAKCFDVTLCDEPMLHEVCFTKGKLDECSNWGNDGYGTGIALPFTYTVDTDGKIPPEEIIVPIENAILDDVAKTIEGSDKYSDFSGKISAAPEDYIAGK